MGNGVDAVLAQARAGVVRCDPAATAAALARGALVVDTRTETQRAEQGELPGALVIDRTVLEWRLDPTGSHRIPEATGWDVEVVVVCHEGFSSSLAAASLRAVGLHRATDLAGGFAAWRDAGFPSVAARPTCAASVRAMAVIHLATLTPGKLELLQAWVPAQPWAAGLDTTGLEQVGAYRFDDPAGEVGTETFLLRCGDGTVLHVPVTYRAEPLDGGALVGTTEHSVLGTRWVHDGPTDPVYAAALAAALLTGTPQADLEYQTPDGPELREPTARVHTDGALGTVGPPPSDAEVAVSTVGTTTVLATGAADLVLLRVLGGAEEGSVGGSVLRGTWTGQDTPVLLAFAR